MCDKKSMFLFLGTMLALITPISFASFAYYACPSPKTLQVMSSKTISAPSIKQIFYVWNVTATTANGVIFKGLTNFLSKSEKPIVGGLNDMAVRRTAKSDSWTMNCMFKLKNFPAYVNVHTVIGAHCVPVAFNQVRCED